MCSPSMGKGAGTNPCHASLACGYNQKPLGITGHTHSHSKSDWISQVQCFLHPGTERQPSSREHPNQATSVMIRETGIFHWVMSRKGGRYSCEDPQLIPRTEECFCTGIYSLPPPPLLLLPPTPHETSASYQPHKPETAGRNRFPPFFLSLSPFFWIYDRELQTKSLYSWKSECWLGSPAAGRCTRQLTPVQAGRAGEGLPAKHMAKDRAADVPAPPARCRGAQLDRGHHLSK